MRTTNEQENKEDIQQKAKWLFDEERSPKCSLCGQRALYKPYPADMQSKTNKIKIKLLKAKFETPEDYIPVLSLYCPHCGAYMKGDGHVEDTENKARWHKPRPFKEVMAELREELSRYTELLSKDEVGKAAAKNILDEVYREVERVRMEIEYQDKDGDYVMNSAEFLSEFTIGSLSQLYEKWGFNLAETVKEEADNESNHGGEAK